MGGGSEAVMLRIRLTDTDTNQDEAAPQELSRSGRRRCWRVMKVNLSVACMSLVILSGCAGGAISRQSQAPSVIPLAESLRATFASCVSPYGVRGNLPIVAETVVGEFIGESIYLSGPGLVSDGYYHSLRLNGERSSGIIVQTGGLANFTTKYGPFELSKGCVAPRASSANSPSTWTAKVVL